MTTAERSSTPDWQIVSAWAPQEGFQQTLVGCPIDEIFAGGARGGGKTDGILGRVLHRAGWYAKRYNCGIFRQEMPQADDLIDRACEMWSPFGDYHKQNRLFRFRNGARARFRPLESVRDAAKYQGQNLTDAVIEEAGNYASPAPIDRLYGALRSVSGVPISMVMTGNPGGAGQSWLKARFVDPAPDGMTLMRTVIPAVPGLHDDLVHYRIFLPGRVTDNRLLLANDPGYIGRLYQVGDKKLVDAWLHGDWNAVEGAFFEEWRDSRHVIPPFEIPEHWIKFRAIDWGYAAPFSVQWWAVVGDETKLDDGRTLPRGALVHYREWYGCKPGQPNVGVRRDADDVAREIVRMTEEEITYSVLDPAAWGTQSGPSIAETMARNKVVCRPADNRRVKTHGHLGGWDQMRTRLRGTDNGEPLLYAFRTCSSFRRVIPLMQHDAARPEDMDTSMEDHIPDAARYACMSRPWARAATSDPEPPREPTLNELLELHEGATEDF